MILKQGQSYRRLFIMIASSDHISGFTGGAPVVKISKGGAIAVTATNSPATEVDSTGCPGLYSIVLASQDTSILGDLGFHCTNASADPTDFVDQVQAQIFTDLLLDNFGNAKIASSYKQNQPAILPFVMTSGSTLAPITGLTVTAQRSINGAGFAPCANPVTEVGNGGYVISLAATDMNGSVIFFRFTAIGANDQDITLYTVP